MTEMDVRFGGNSAAAGPNDSRSLPVVDDFGRQLKRSSFIEGEIDRGAWRPVVVPSDVSGISRPMTIYVARRSSKLIKWAWHGDRETFCPPTWADIAIGSGACGLGCRSCFLMLTFRALRDPLRPVVYDNVDDYERSVRRWLRAERWQLEVEEVDSNGKKRKRSKWRKRGSNDAIGLGIDCADSLLWEGVTGHARRLIPLFTDKKTNPKNNPLILLTKTANTNYLTEIPDTALRRREGAVPNVAVTMSLNPEPIADFWEGKFPDTLERITPPISRRLAALRAAQDMGFDVRVRVDPIFTPSGWEQMYADFFHEMAEIHGLLPSMITLGTYREKTPRLDSMRKFWGLPPMEVSPEKTGDRDGTHYHAVGRDRIYRTMKQIIVSTFSQSGSKPWVSLCKETHDVRQGAGLCNANCNCLPLTDVPRRHLQIYGAEGTS